jgi:hypothetical protein
MSVPQCYSIPRISPTAHSCCEHAVFSKPRDGSLFGAQLKGRSSATASALSCDDLAAFFEETMTALHSLPASAASPAPLEVIKTTIYNESELCASVLLLKEEELI